MRYLLYGLCVFGLFAWPTVSNAASIRHASTAQLTDQTTVSTTYVDVPGGSVTAAQLTSAGINVGDTVLIVVTGQVSQTTNHYFMRFLHGSTVFDGLTDHDIGTPGASGFRKAFRYFTTWDVVSSEDIKIQFHVLASGTTSIDQISIVVLDLEDLNTADWATNDLATDGALDTVFLAGATVTVIPSVASDWLVMTWAQISHTNTTVSGISRLSRSGEASSALPEERYEARISTIDAAHYTGRVFSLGAASNTFTEESAEASATTFTRTHSKVFALNLNAFRNHAFAYTEADLALSATDYATLLQTVNITPSNQGDVWVFGDWGFDRQDATREAEFRIQIDNVDDPAGQTTDNYQIDASGGDATDEGWMAMQTVVTNMTAAAHTIDLDASADATTGTPAGQYRTLGAVTMDLALTDSGSMLLRGVGR